MHEGVAGCFPGPGLKRCLASSPVWVRLTLSIAQMWRARPGSSEILEREGYEGRQRIDIFGRRALGVMGVGRGPSERRPAMRPRRLLIVKRRYLRPKPDTRLAPVLRRSGFAPLLRAYRARQGSPRPTILRESLATLVRRRENESRHGMLDHCSKVAAWPAGWPCASTKFQMVASWIVKRRPVALMRMPS